MNLRTPGDLASSPAPSMVETEADDDDPGPPRGRRRYVVVGAVLVVAVAGAGGTAVVLNDRHLPTANPSARTIATGSITRADVVDTESVDGKLMYPGKVSIPAAANGVVTWVPTAGVKITRGGSLYKVANQPVTLMYGSLPLYRTLQKGVSKGPDVKQLESNLKALGYGDDLTVDTRFTAATATAVKNWQKDRGLPKTGSVDASQVVFESGPVRVSEVALAKGDRSGGGAALTVTAISPIVQVALDAGKQDLVRKGVTVGVELPAGNTVPGRITTVGTVATLDKDGNPTIEVDLSLSAKKIGHVDEAPVTVDLVSQRAENVLSVPVEALLGLREGGFGVQVVEGTGTRTVSVQTGAFGGGRVEITGEGLSAGMKVEVPSS